MPQSCFAFTASSSCGYVCAVCCRIGGGGSTITVVGKIIGNYMTIKSVARRATGLIKKLEEFLWYKTCDWTALL